MWMIVMNFKEKMFLDTRISKYMQLSRVAQMYGSEQQLVQYTNGHEPVYRANY